MPQTEMKRQQSEFIKKWTILADFCLFIIILIILLLKLHLIFLLNIDIDEFTFLSSIYQHLNGNLSNPLFTLHVHFFSWLPLISENEVNQIITARVFMYLLGLGSCTFIYLIGRMFFFRSGALFYLLCYLSISNVIVHGASFRFDPICVFFLMMSIYFSLKKNSSLLAPIISGFSMAVSLMVSLKTIFYLPVVALIYLSRFFLNSDRKLILKKMSVFLFALIFGFFLVYMFHSFTLSHGQIQSVNSLTNKISSMNIIFSKLIPEPIYLFMIFYENLFILMFWLVGLLMVLYYLILSKNIKKSKYCSMLPLLIPLLSLLGYKFSYPYFYAFIIPSAVLFSGALINKLVKDFKSGGSKVVLVSIFSLNLICFLNFIQNYKIHAFNQIVSQKEIVDVVHKMFPEPVPYIDRCSMISSFPKVGLQMTTWDMEIYTDANRPIMHNILLKYKPVFILANIVHLDLALPRGQKRGIYKINPLLEEDFNILKNNFIHHWGNIYAAGKQFHFNSKKRIQTFEILIPGIYTLEADGEVMINGVGYESGSKIEFQRTTYTIESQKLPMSVNLRWGNDLYKPPFKPSTQPLFLGYYLQALRDYPD